MGCMVCVQVWRSPSRTSSARPRRWSACANCWTMRWTVATRASGPSSRKWERSECCLPGSQGPFLVLGNWFFNKRPFQSFDSAHGSFLLVRRSFPLLWGPLKVGVPSNSVLRTGSCIFAVVSLIAMWLLEADDTPAMLQSKESIPVLVVNVCPQSPVDPENKPQGQDKMASTFPL